MNEERRRRLPLVARVAAVMVVMLLAFALFLRYSFRSAERSAQEFCDQIPQGSEISAAIAKAKEGKIAYAFNRWYTFSFPSTLFDKAVCEVSVDGDGKVTSKSTDVRYD